MSDRRQICYFPYLFLKNRDTVEFDGITVWNFSILKSKRIADKKFRDYVSKLLVTNRLNGKPIKDLGVVAMRKKEDYKPLNRTEQKKVDDLRKILFLCSVADANIYQGSNAGHRMVTRENFAVVYQNFTIDSPYTAYSSGRIVSTLAGGYKIGEVKYEVPRHVLHNAFTFDEKLLNAMTALKHKQSAMYLRILRATDAMMNGYSNSDDVSYESRILEQSRAFEILFNLPEGSQRKEFKLRIAKYCQEDNERVRGYQSERRQTRKEWEKGTRQVMWADRFYTLRNHIIHGDQLKDNDFFFFGQPHHQLGLWFFIASVKNMTNSSLGNRIFYDTIQCDSGHFRYDKQLIRAALETALNQMHLKKGGNGV